VFVRVWLLIYAFDIQPLDSLLHHYGKITNIIARYEKLKRPSADHTAFFFSELIACKGNVDKWKKTLPPGYEAALVLIVDSDLIKYPETLQNYPYEARLDYMTGQEGK
jgi:hypothetical protein